MTEQNALRNCPGQNTSYRYSSVWPGFPFVSRMALTTFLFSVLLTETVIQTDGLVYVWDNICDKIVYNQNSLIQDSLTYMNNTWNFSLLCLTKNNKRKNVRRELNGRNLNCSFKLNYRKRTCYEKNVQEKKSSAVLLFLIYIFAFYADNQGEAYSFFGFNFSDHCEKASVSDLLVM